MEPLHERIELLEEENGELKVELEKMRNKQAVSAV